MLTNDKTDWERYFSREQVLESAASGMWEDWMQGADLLVILEEIGAWFGLVAVEMKDL